MTKYLLTFFVVCTAICQAEVRLPKLIGSNMVLQRDCEVKSGVGPIREKNSKWVVIGGTG